MATSNLFRDLRNALNNLKAILDANSAVLKPAIQTLKSVLPQVGDLLNQLISLMDSLKAEIQNLDVSNVTGLSELASFAASAEAVLQDSEDLLPERKADIDSVLGTLSILESLPSLPAVRQDILTLIDGVIANLNLLNS
jgi:ABC-type transporter Mla subunit MlaD